MDKKKLEELIDESYEKIKEIYSAPHAAKSNLMQTDGKLAINLLNFYKSIRQSESGKEQTRAVLAKMTCGSIEEIREFVEQNIPEIKIKKGELPEAK